MNAKWWPMQRWRFFSRFFRVFVTCSVRLIPVGFKIAMQRTPRLLIWSSAELYGRPFVIPLLNMQSPFKMVALVSLGISWKFLSTTFKKQIISNDIKWMTVCKIFLQFGCPLGKLINVVTVLRLLYGVQGVCKKMWGSGGVFFAVYRAAIR